VKIQESAQNDWETILTLSTRKPVVRSSDIVKALNFVKPRVSAAMKNLKKNGYIRIGSNYNITLTEKSMAIAQDMHSRHVVLTGCLMRLGAGSKIAAQDACRIKHILSADRFAAIKVYAEQNQPSS
jgi:Mn-dependent DtxR family transcriptional regulator